MRTVVVPAGELRKVLNAAAHHRRDVVIEVLDAAEEALEGKAGVRVSAGGYGEHAIFLPFEPEP